MNESKKKDRREIQKNRQRRDSHEACKDIKYKKVTEHNQDRWMWRVPDIMPVCM